MVQRLISTFQNIVRYLSLSDSDHRISYHHPGSQFGVYSHGIFHVKCSQGFGPLSRHHRCHWYAPRLGGRFHYRLRIKFIIKFYLNEHWLMIIKCHTQGFDNMIKSLKKHEHKIVLTRTMPEILPILSGIGCDLHILSEGMDLELFIKGTF